MWVPCAAARPSASCANQGSARRDAAAALQQGVQPGRSWRLVSSGWCAVKGQALQGMPPPSVAMQQASAKLCKWSMLWLLVLCISWAWQQTQLQLVTVPSVHSNDVCTVSPLLPPCSPTGTVRGTSQGTCQTTGCAPALGAARVPCPPSAWALGAASPARCARSAAQPPRPSGVRGLLVSGGGGGSGEVGQGRR